MSTTAEERAWLLQNCDCTPEIDGDGDLAHEESCVTSHIIADLEAAVRERGEAVALLRDIGRYGRFSKSPDIATFLAKQGASA